MARPLRVEFAGAWYHVMNRGVDHRRIFFSERDRSCFLHLLGDTLEIFRLETHAFCLMSNHYHLLVRTPDAGLGRAMRHLNGVYTQRVNRLAERDGPLFRGRYRAILVDNQTYQLRVSRYIHLNPVGARLVDSPQDYVHSSYRYYRDPCMTPEWLHTREILAEFGGRQGYARYVEDGIDEETRKFYGRARIAPVFGGIRFRSMAKQHATEQGRHLDPEIPSARSLDQRPSLSQISRAVARVFGIAPTDIQNATTARSVALHLGRHEAGRSLAELATWLGYRSYNSAATALARLRTRLTRPGFRQRLNHVRDQLYKVET